MLREKIHNGELQPGADLPGEIEMAAQYGVGRPAVRQALGVLRAEALVVTRRGEGTRVREQPDRRRVEIRPGEKAWFRQPTPGERVEMRIDEGRSWKRGFVPLGTAGFGDLVLRVWQEAQRRPSRTWASLVIGGLPTSA